MAGYREFQTGEVLTAANVNSFLMEQATMTFADAAARDAALAGVLREGLLTYNLDTGALERYDGTAWVPAAPVIPGIGSNVVSTVKTDHFTSTSATFTAVTGLTASITPTSATSKVLVIAQIAHGLHNGNGWGHFKVTRGETDVYLGDASGTNRVRAVFGGFMDGGQNAIISGSIVFLDSPETTSAATYEVRVRRGGATSGVFINRSQQNVDGADVTNGASSITLIEVAP